MKTKPPSDSPVVALIEDHPYMRRSLEQFVTSCGFRCFAFPSGQEFLDSEVRTKAKCVVLDVKLGEMDGFALQEKLAGELPTVPRIFFTGSTDPDSEARALAGGAVGYITKSGSPERLIDVIREALAAPVAPRKKSRRAAA